MNIFTAVFLLLILLTGCSTKEQTMLDRELLDAALSGDIKKVEELLNAGANINTVSKKDNSWGSFSVNVSLGRVRRPADWTALHNAVWNNHQELVNFLIYRGADLDIQNEDGDTALIIAVRRQYIEIVEMLINAGANIELENKHNETAATVTYKLGNAQIIKLLMNKN